MGLLFILLNTSNDEDMSKGNSFYLWITCTIRKHFLILSLYYTSGPRLSGIWNSISGILFPSVLQLFDDNSQVTTLCHSKCIHFFKLFPDVFPYQEPLLGTLHLPMLLINVWYAKEKPMFQMCSQMSKIQWYLYVLLLQMGPLIKQT